MSRNSLGRKPKNIRSRNIELIMNLYRENESLSVSEIARMIKLSRTTVMKINEDLLERKIIEGAGKGDSTEEGGKPPAIFRFNATRNLILTFHIKYDRIEFRLSDLKYNCLSEDTEKMPLNAPFSMIAEKMYEILKRNRNCREKGCEILACLIAIHGNVDPESGTCIHSTHFPSWGTYTNLRDIVQKELKLDCPIHIDAWTRYKVYGESKLGRGRGYDTVVLIDAGWHGINSGILLKGEVYTGKHYLSGEIGHITVNRDDDETCACGSKGCLEQQLNLARLKSNISSMAVSYPDSPLASCPSDSLTIQTILESADRGDPMGRAVVEEVIFWFALALSQIIMIVDPDVILFEGDYACGSPFFEEGLLEQCKQMALPRIKERNTEILFSNRDFIHTLEGAAVMAVDRYYNFD